MNLVKYLMFGMEQYIHGRRKHLSYNAAKNFYRQNINRVLDSFA